MSHLIASLTELDSKQNYQVGTQDQVALSATRKKEICNNDVKKVILLALWVVSPML